MNNKYVKTKLILLLNTLTISFLIAQDYPIIHTGVTEYSGSTSSISKPSKSDSFYGQDADYLNNIANYTDNGNGTITDNITGLVWQKDPGEKMTFPDCFTNANSSTLGGHSDWRVPTIKELFSLIMFYGWENTSQETSTPFIDTSYFIQPYGDVSAGERFIDAQTWSATEYVGTTMNNDATVFGVNFVDGRIKGYPKYKPGTGESVFQTMHCRLVRGNSNYGINNLKNNNDGTISDLATGLMWQQADDGTARNWEEALAYAVNLDLAGYDDWRLPNIKELQSIVDYTRSPQTTNSPAIDAMFSCTEINDPDGNPGQYPHYWSGTTHKTGKQEFSNAAYIAFGEAQGKPNTKILDVHGAGAQRSDPKSGNIADYPQYHGPQGDVQYVYNYVRAVRNITPTSIASKDFNAEVAIYPTRAHDYINYELANYHLITNYAIYSLDGKIIANGTIDDVTGTINLGNIPKGSYFIKFNTSEISINKRFFKL
ncbi:MAG: DUF1566 domain-containing protein [Bacteroidales bacterium]|nr:DUF1566 domain-containing protein [Bacteroidales bacterium]